MNETENQSVVASEASNPGVREDILHYDPLLDCLVELSRFHGRPATRAALTAGLPLEKGSLTPSLFARAANRAGLSAKVVRRRLDRIDLALLPVVLLTSGDEACVLLGWDESGETARLLFPETGQGSVQLSRDELAQRYSGVAIFARPHFRFDKRTPEVGDVKLRHWFWGALADQWLVYRDVLAAALLINVFALAMPLFTMNVYDRVVPNRALETLWTLALGLILVIGVDLVLRLLRGAGPAGLRGIHALRDDGIWRPFLGLSRRDLEERCREAGWAWRDDSSNRDQRFLRNWIRHAWLPEGGQELERALAGVATAAARLASALEARMAFLERSASLSCDPSGFRLDLRPWSDDPAHPELDLLLERAWTSCHRRPWAAQQRRRLVEDTLSMRTGRRRGGQGETAIWGGGTLQVRCGDILGKAVGSRADG